MSLDITLHATETIECDNCGHKHYVPDYEVYGANITHNLGKMAGKAEIYQHLWRPEELNIKMAKDLIEPIQRGLADMKARPDFYKKFDSPNGWGTYDDFIPWIENYLSALESYPEALVKAYR